MKRSALFIGLNQEDEILLQHKTVDAPTNSNLWVLFGGHIEEGEEPEKTIKREMKEELNILIIPNFFKVFTSEESWGKQERHIFYGIVGESRENLRTALTEGDDVNFFAHKELQSLPLNKQHFNIIKLFLKEGF